MAIIRDGEQARSILERMIRDGNTLPCFCTESLYTTEAIFMGASRFKTGQNIKDNLPLIIAFTASYKDRPQLLNYTGFADYREGMLAVRSDIERLARADGPFNDLDVIVHLDHGQPGQDDWIINEHGDFISSVMWDCSHYSLKDNIRMMKEFVARHRRSFIIEGAVDEIYNYSPGNTRLDMTDKITNPAAAEIYYHETGVDLLVPNLGTEHRRTEGTVNYHGDVARQISDKVGRRLVLHGTSSLNQDELASLPGDGIVKVNLWANLEAVPGKQLAEKIIRELENILPADTAASLVNEGLLGRIMLEKTYRPSIAFLTEKFRRDEIYLPVASSIVQQFYELLYGFREVI
jgi:fructose-bisphosphate aldolase class II